MTTDPRAAAIVAGAVRLAHSLDLGVVAEGVAGPDVARALLALGCSRGQGNSLAEAMAPEAIEALLADRLAPHSNAAG